MTADDLTRAIERLRPQKAEHEAAVEAKRQKRQAEEDRKRERAAAEGRQWALERATYAELKKVATAREMLIKIDGLRELTGCKIEDQAGFLAAVRKAWAEIESKL